MDPLGSTDQLSNLAEPPGPQGYAMHEAGIQEQGSYLQQDEGLLGKRMHEDIEGHAGSDLINQQMGQQMQPYGAMHDADSKRRGRPKGRTALNSFIENGVERRKYFVNRIKVTLTLTLSPTLALIQPNRDESPIHHPNPTLN